MNEKNKDQHQALRENRQGIATVVGVIIFVAVGLIVRGDLLFGLVMATVFSSGMHAGQRISKALIQNGQGNAIPPRIIGSVVAGVVAALIIAVVQGLIDVAPMEGDNIIVVIIKLFFDSNAAIAVGAGALVGSLLHGEAQD